MTKQKRKLLRARTALSFYERYGRRPTDQELEERVRRALRIHASNPAASPDHKHNVIAGYASTTSQLYTNLGQAALPPPTVANLSRSRNGQTAQRTMHLKRAHRDR